MSEESIATFVAKSASAPASSGPTCSAWAETLATSLTTSLATTPFQYYYNEYYYGSFLPWWKHVAILLDIPEAGIYKNALRESLERSYDACGAILVLVFLTAKPPLLLLWWTVSKLGVYGYDHGGRSCKQLALLARDILVRFYLFQRSLDRIAVLGECGLLLLCFGLYHLRKWLLQQTYWKRFLDWQRTKKRKLVKSYTNTVRKIARVSKMLALALPHLLFLGGLTGLFGLHLLPRGTLQWITYETPLIGILTVYYPLASTLFLLCGFDRLDTNHDEDNCDSGTTSKSAGAPTKSINMDNSSSSNILERAKTFENSETSRNKLTTRLQQRRSSESNLATTLFWLEYWQLYAVVEILGNVLSVLPSVLGLGGLLFGLRQFLETHPWILFVTGECQLVFFVWVFAMERLLGGTKERDQEQYQKRNLKQKQHKKNDETEATSNIAWAEALPLRLLQTILSPRILQLHSAVSETIPEDLWQKWIVSKTERVITLAVLLRLVSQETKDFLLSILTNDLRVLAVPSLALLLPGFLTRFGVTYVQYVVPVARSAHAAKTANGATTRNNNKKQRHLQYTQEYPHASTIVYLKYWILHCGISWILTKIEGFLWWIPFSTHGIFLLWSYLVVPSTIEKWYEVFESELRAFGILPSNITTNHRANGETRDGSNAMTSASGTWGIRETKTYGLFQSVVQRLPSAAHTEDDDDKDRDSKNNVNTDEDNGRCDDQSNGSNEQRGSNDPADSTEKETTTRTMTMEVSDDKILFQKQEAIESEEENYETETTSEEITEEIAELTLTERYGTSDLQ